jgi:Spy/CpxP family protein refolding chaperone
MMINFKSVFLRNISLLAFVLLAFTAVSAQQQLKPDAEQGDKPDAPLFQQLNLAPEQIKQIRTINRDTREQMRGAAQKQREARRALDSAIYADNPNEQEIEKRLQEFSDAQAAVSKMRARTEFRIRRILNNEQLALFREFRQRAGDNDRQMRRTGLPRQGNRQNRLPLRNRRQF